MFANATSKKLMTRRGYVLPVVIASHITATRPQATRVHPTNARSLRTMELRSVQLPLLVNPTNPLTAALLEAHQILATMELHNMKMKRDQAR